MKIRGATWMAILVVAGCGPAAGSAQPSQLVSSPAAPASASAAASTTVEPSADLVSPREIVAGPLPAGTYTRASFRPRITFELDEGWVAGSLAPGFFDVQQQAGTPDVMAVQFASVDAVVGADGVALPATTAQEAAAAIGANPGLTVLGESESRLGGATGRTVEVENGGTAHAGILDVPAGRLGIDPQRRLWISLFDTAEGVLAVMVGGSVGDWDHALAVAEPVLESVVIEVGAASPPP